MFTVPEPPKHALEGYTETLDHEVRRFDVRAVLMAQ
jgi:hypothetical protein